MPTSKTVNTISKSAEILKIIANGCNRLEDIYPEIGLNKSTTHRLLRSLSSVGLAFQNPLNRNYYLGPLFVKLSSNLTISHQVLIFSAINELESIRDETGETSMIMISFGIERMVLKEIPSKQQISLSLGDGNAAPMCVGSSGRTLLSFYSDKEIYKILEQIEETPAYRKTIIDKNLLKAEIENIRKNGFGTSSGETHPDAAGISIPIKGYFFPVALCVMGPKYRFNPISILKRMRTAASKISDTLFSLQK
jgi:IclR family KDG regulon transcriptional repressor